MARYFRLTSLLAFLFLAASGSFIPVFAQSAGGCVARSGNYICDTREQAYQMAKSVPISTCSFASSMCLNLLEPRHNFIPQPEVYKGFYLPVWLVDFGTDGKLERLATTSIYYLSECVTGSAWDGSSNTCSCPSGQIRNSLTGNCMKSCSSRPNKSSVTYSVMIPNGSIGCDSGCMYIAQSNGDGTYSNTFFGDGESFHCIASPTNCGDNGPGWTMNYGLNMCVPPLDDCPSNQVKDPVTGMCKLGCPSGMSADSTGVCKPESNTCPAGQTKGPDGSCVSKPDSCGEGKTAGADGTCKKDGDSDKDDGDNDKYFSGGDSCSSPPVCSGDPIMCGQARIQWRIECNTRRNVNIAGGACNAMPVCTGELCNAMEYSQLLMQWRTACALEKDKSATGDEGDSGQPGWTKVDGMNQDGGQGEVSGDTQGVQTKTQSLDSLDSGGWLGGAGSCPAIMAGGGDGLGGSFAQALASPPAYFCQFIGMMAAIVLLGAAVVSSFILARF